MAASITDLIEGAFLPALLAVALAISGGIILSRKQRHVFLAKILLRGVVLGLGVYPILYAHSTNDAPLKRLSATAICGAMLGSAYWAIGWWFDNEAKNKVQETNEAEF